MGRQYYFSLVVPYTSRGAWGHAPRNILVFLCHLVQYEANIRISNMTKSGGQLPPPPPILHHCISICIRQAGPFVKIYKIYHVSFTLSVSLHVLYLYFIAIYTVYILQSSLSLSKYVFKFFNCLFFLPKMADSCIAVCLAHLLKQCV